MESEAHMDVPQPSGEGVPLVAREDSPASLDPVAIGPESQEQGQAASATAGASGAVQPPDGTRHAPVDRAHVRERILRRFETWLDDVLENEEPIQGIAAEILEQLECDPAAGESRGAEAGCDLYALWSTVTAMTEETRLQGRAFKQLHDSLSPMQELVGSVGDVLQRYTASLEQQDQRFSEATRQVVLREVLGTLIDVRDRLVRGTSTATTWLEQAHTPPKLGLGKRLWRRVFPLPPAVQTPHEEAVRSLLKGYHLSQEVLDEALARFGVRPMECVGRPFDPGTMKAVDIDSQSDAGDGTVLEVYRQGYWWQEAVYRPAEVKVARKLKV
jgi:molecular chaperone GrpE